MRSVESFVHSNMFMVRFAGFQATGFDLQQAGWSFTAYQNMSNRSYGFDLQLMMQHKGGVTMVSQMNVIDMGRFMRIAENGRRLEETVFDTMALSVDGKSSFLVNPKPYEISFSNRQFNPIDATPSYERIDLSTFDFNKFGVFKRLNDSANIFLPEKTVNEILDDILFKQKPLQEEIRKNRKRESFMQEFNRNPNEDIKLQLVAV